MTALWNQLVAIERETEQTTLARARSDDADVDAALEEIAQLSQASSAAQSAEQRQALIRARRETRSRLWAALGRWRRGHRDMLRVIEHARRETVKQARQNAHAWWPNYNITIQRYEAARAAIRKRPWKRLRMHDPSCDDGGVAVQIQRTASGLGASPDELGEDRLSMLSITPPPSFATGRAKLCLRVDAAGSLLEAYMLVHRPVPSQSRIKGAQLHWRRRGRRLRFQLVLQVDEDRAIAPAAYRRSGALALDWEPVAEGLRVATIGDELLILPRRWMARMEYGQACQAWLDRSKAEQMELATPDVQAMLELPAHKMLAELAQRGILPHWRRGRYGWASRYEEYHHLRAKLLAQRREYYRLWARRIVGEYTEIDMDDRALDCLARSDRGTDSNRYRQWAAPHTLRAEIIHQANKAGAVVRAGARVLTATNAEKLGVWQRRKRFAAERSQKLVQQAQN